MKIYTVLKKYRQTPTYSLSLCLLLFSLLVLFRGLKALVQQIGGHSWCSLVPRIQCHWRWIFKPNICRHTKRIQSLPGERRDRERLQIDFIFSLSGISLHSPEQLHRHLPFPNMCQYLLDNLKPHQKQFNNYIN